MSRMQSRIALIWASSGRLAMGATLVGVLFSVFLAACGSTSTSNKQPYTFALLGPLSGANSIYGVNLKNGVELAVQQVNKAGGINGHKVALSLYDTQCTASGAATAAADVASGASKPFAVIGDVCSGATLAALPVLYRAGIAEISGDSTSPLITSVVKSHHYTNFVRTIPSDAEQAVDMLLYAHDILHKNRVAILYSNDDYGQPIYAAQVPEIAKLGMTLVASAAYTPTTTVDFTSQLTKLAAGSPSVVLMDGYYNDLGTAVRQMPKVSFPKVPLILAAGAADNGYTQLAGSAATGSLVFSYYSPGYSLPANLTFVKQYRAAYHTAPNEQSAHGYGIVELLKAAIEKYGATPKTLISVLKKHTFPGTPTGTLGFTQFGDVTHQAGVIEIATSTGLQLDQSATAAMNALLSK